MMEMKKLIFTGHGNGISKGLGIRARERRNSARTVEPRLIRTLRFVQNAVSESLHHLLLLLLPIEEREKVQD